jgi:hypothetical protein
VALGDKTTYGLLESDAKYKHIVLITDDDPSMPNDSTIQKLIDNHISVSTITVSPQSDSGKRQGSGHCQDAVGQRSGQGHDAVPAGLWNGADPDQT